MKSQILIAVALAGAGLQSLAAQQLTPRQLFYKDDAEAKPAAAPAKAAPSKAAPKAAPKKTAPAAGVKSDPQPAPVASGTPRLDPPVAAPGRSDAPQVTTAAFVQKPLGLRYALSKVVDGAESEVSPTATFRSGDKVRVTVEGNRDGFLYVIARGSSGNWKPLFPASDINGGDNKIVARRVYRVPSNTQAFEFDEQAGEERLFIIFSAEPVKDMEAMIPSLASPEKTGKPEKTDKPLPIITASARPISDEFVSRLRNTYSRDLIVQTVTPSQPAESSKDATLPENAVYIVNQSGGRLVADIRLEHK